MTDDTTAALNRIADALELAALIEARKNSTGLTELENTSISIHDDYATSRWHHYTNRIDQLTGYQEADHD